MKLEPIVSILIVICFVGLSGGCMKSGYPDEEWLDCDAQPQPHPKSAAARSILWNAVNADRGAGISAAVMVNGRVVWTDAVGVAHGNQPLTTKARMRIGSISKVLTATLAVRLFEEGILNLDASIREYMPELPDTYAPVTVRHLLTHTSGIRQYDFSSLQDSNNTVHHESLAEAFDRHREEPLVHAPGQRLLYSSLGYNLLGIVIERASGQSYEEALLSWITEPMGLASTTTDDASKLTQCRPRFYSILFGKLRIPTMWRDNSDLYPSGGLLSSAEDLVRFAYEVFNSPLLDAEAKVLLTRRDAAQDHGMVYYGYGWQIAQDEDGSTRWIGHGGTINGAYASLRYYPRYDMVVAGIANYDWLMTNERAAFFQAVRVGIPSLFADAQSSSFSD